MTPLYEQSGPKIAFWTLFAVFAVGEYVMRFRTRSNRSGTRVERWSLAVVVVTAAVGIGGGLKLADWHGAAIDGVRWPLFILGLLLMALGFSVRQWAILTLGRFFTVDVRVHPNQTVVERGPYRWVRHPAYSGLLLFFVGIGFALDNWASFVVVAVVPAVGLLIRIRVEERALLEGLGDDYLRYAAAHRRLFPGIW